MRVIVSDYHRHFEKDSFTFKILRAEGDWAKRFNITADWTENFGSLFYQLDNDLGP